MFNKDFYPTPLNVVEIMLDGVDLTKVKTVLEPSAGKGDLIDGLCKTYEKRMINRFSSLGVRRQDVKANFDIDCVEIEPDLQAILESKGLRIVGDDFMHFHTHKQYDLIIANFPFSEGARHLRRAIGMAQNGGSMVVALVNAETIKNAYTNERSVLRTLLEEYDADITYHSGLFKDSERPTGVEVAMVKVKVPNENHASLILNGLKAAREKLDPLYEERNELATGDLFQNLVNQYNAELDAYMALIREYTAVKKVMLDVMENGNLRAPIITLSVTGGSKNALSKDEYENGFVNDMCRQLRKKYWEYLFSHPQFVGRMTTNLKKVLETKLSEMTDYEFSLYNINKFARQIIAQVNDGIEKTIMDLFDKMTFHSAYYDGSNNIHYYNGWRTNKAYKLNKKVVQQYNAYETWSGRSDFDPCKWDLVERLSDVEKTFAYLEGGKVSTEEIRTILRTAKENGQTKNIETKYFFITFYKKGTAHLVFKDDELLKRFNLFAAKRKNWLPDFYGKVRYEDMDAEAKACVDSFEGRESYAHTMNMGNIAGFIGV